MASLNYVDALNMNCETALSKYNIKHPYSALGVPVADYTYDDCRLMHKAKLRNLPCETGLIEFLKLRQRFG